MSDWNHTRTEKLMQAAMKKHAGVPKNRCLVNYRGAESKSVLRCPARIICFHPLTALPMKKVRAALYYIGILLRPRRENDFMNDWAELCQERPGIGWVLVARIEPIR